MTETQDATEVLRTQAERVPPLYRVVIGLMVVLFVCVMALAFQIQRRNQIIDRVVAQNIQTQQIVEQTRVAADRATVASETATGILQAAVASGQESRPDTEAALESIKRIEDRLNQVFPPGGEPPGQ